MRPFCVSQSGRGSLSLIRSATQRGMGDEKMCVWIFISLFCKLGTFEASICEREWSIISQWLIIAEIPWMAHASHQFIASISKIRGNVINNIHNCVRANCPEILLWRAGSQHTGMEIILIYKSLMMILCPFWYCVCCDEEWNIYWAHVGKCAKVRHYSSHVKKRWVMILCVCFLLSFLSKYFSLRGGVGSLQPTTITNQFFHH